MYNGIGLQTPRGSGTNGYIQTNKFFVRPKTGKVAFTSNGFEGDQGTAGISKKPNKEILEHDRKRLIILKLEMLKDELLDKGCTDQEVEERVEKARKQMEASALLEDIGACTAAVAAETKISETQSHQIAARKEKQLEVLRAALKIRQKTPDNDEAAAMGTDGDGGNPRSSRKSDADVSFKRREKVEHPFLDRKFSWKRSSPPTVSAEQDHARATKNETRTSKHKKDQRGHKYEPSKKKRRVLDSDSDFSHLPSYKNKMKTLSSSNSDSDSDQDKKKKKNKKKSKKEILKREKKRKANYHDTDDSISDYSTYSENENKKKKKKMKKKKREYKKQKSSHERLEVDSDSGRERGERKPCMEERERKQARKRERDELCGEEKRSAIDELVQKRRRYERDDDDDGGGCEHGDGSHGRRREEERGSRHRDREERVDCYSKRDRYGICS